jgi:hypothetical protein
MLAVTLLLDRDLGLGIPGLLSLADISSQNVTVRQRRTARYPPLGMGAALTWLTDSGAQIRSIWRVVMCRP